MEYDENYWRDYSAFIEKVETFTSKSPLDLLGRYADCAEALEDEDFKYNESFKYEFGYGILIREEIEKVIVNPALENNKLLVGFKEKIEKLDERIKPFLKNSDKKNWWVNFELKNFDL